MAIKFVKLLQRVRVFAGYVFTVLFVIFCRPTGQLLMIGSGIVVVGLGVRAWACGHLRKKAELDTSGPYSYTRNPLYLGSFLITIGFAIASGVWWLALLSVIFFLSIYLPVMNVERRELEEVIGDEYKRYVDSVPTFVPRLTSAKLSDRRFDFQLYLKNGEYEAAIGVLAIVLVLTAKAYFTGTL